MSNHSAPRLPYAVLLPRRMRRAAEAVLAFAHAVRTIAEPHTVNPAERLRQLHTLKADLHAAAVGRTPQHPLIQRLQYEAIVPFRLPETPFYDLLAAAEQNITKNRYQNFGELVDYARRAANPVGRLLLHILGRTDARSIAQSDGICTALQLIHCCQNVAADWEQGRIYLPQEELARFQVGENDLAEQRCTPAFQRLAAFQCERAFKMLKAGSPLANTLTGRSALALRLLVLEAQFKLQKIDQARYDVFRFRPALIWKDRLAMLKKALWK